MYFALWFYCAVARIDNFVPDTEAEISHLVLQDVFATAQDTKQQTDKLNYVMTRATAVPVISVLSSPFRRL